MYKKKKFKIQKKILNFLPLPVSELENRTQNLHIAPFSISE